MAPIIRRRQLTRQQAPAEPPEESSILRDAAKNAMTGIHSGLSLLTLPSRAVWGTANAMAGGPGGFGNLDPWDATGGIELSQFLENQGVIGPNDPTKWEAMDFGRFGLDVLGDPTSYLGFGALTKTGKAASAAGKLTKGIPQQIARGERALLGVQLPFSPKATGLIGTGEAAGRLAEAGQRAGQRILNANIPGTQAKPLRWLTSKFDWRKLGMRQPETQGLAPEFAQRGLNNRRGVAETLQGTAKAWRDAGMDSSQWQSALALARETALGFEVPVSRPFSDAPDVGKIRYYHGGNEIVDGPRWLSPQKEYAEGYSKKSGGIVHYVDLDANDPRLDELFATYDYGNGVKTPVAFEAPEDIARLLKPVGVGTETTRLVTAADGPEFWQHLDPTGGLGRIDELLRGVSATRDLKGLSRTGDLQDVVKNVFDLEDLAETFQSAGMRAGHLFTPEQATELAEDAAKRWENAEVTRYLPRFMRPKLRKELERGSVRGAENLSAQVPSDVGRNDMLKGIRGGRTMVDAIVTDEGADKLIRDLAAEAESPAQQELSQRIAEMMDELDALEADGVDPDELAEFAAEIADLQEQLLDRPGVIRRVADNLRGRYGGYVEPLFQDSRTGDQRDRLEAIAEWMIDNPELRQMSVFGSDMAGDLWRYLDNAAASENNFDFAADVIRRHSVPGRAVDRPDVADPKFQKVGSLLGTLGLDVKKASEYIGSQLGERGEAVIERTLPKHIADDLMQVRDAIRPPTEQDIGRGAFQKFMSAWKAGALSWPRRIVRDLVSGQARNWENGWLSMRSLSDAEHLFHGRALRGYERIPAVQEWIAEYGLEPTAEGATEAISRKLGAYMAESPGIFADLADDGPMAGGIERLLRAMPGQFPGSEMGSIKQGAKDLFSNLTDVTGIPGVRDIPEATFGPVKVAQKASEYTDYMNRATAFLGMLRNGESDLPTIFNKIDAAQVNYDFRRNAPADRVAKNLFPFWRFFSRQVPYVLADITMNPGGRMATVAKTVDRGIGGDPTLPDYALSGTALPLGESPEGGKAFLTGLGLMHETPLEMLGQAAAGDVRGLGYSLAGQMNPLIQKPIEGVTGQSLWREGEKLSDLDPTLGRMLSNVGESVGLLPAGSEPIRFPGDGYVDAGLSLVPGVGSLATQVRTAADPRRPAWERAMQLGTGARITRQSEKAQRRVLRKRIEQLAEEEGGRLGTHLYARESDLAANPRLAEIIEVSRQLEREAAADRKPRRKLSRLLN